MPPWCGQTQMILQRFYKVNCVFALNLRPGVGCFAGCHKQSVTSPTNPTADLSVTVFCAAAGFMYAESRLLMSPGNKTPLKKRLQN